MLQKPILRCAVRPDGAFYWTLGKFLKPFANEKSHCSFNWKFIFDTKFKWSAKLHEALIQTCIH